MIDFALMKRISICARLNPDAHEELVRRAKRAGKAPTTYAVQILEAALLNEEISQEFVPAVRLEGKDMQRLVSAILYSSFLSQALAQGREVMDEDLRKHSRKMARMFLENVSATQGDSRATASESPSDAVAIPAASPDNQKRDLLNRLTGAASR